MLLLLGKRAMVNISTSSSSQRLVVSCAMVHTRHVNILRGRLLNAIIEREAKQEGDAHMGSMQLLNALKSK